VKTIDDSTTFQVVNEATDVFKDDNQLIEFYVNKYVDKHEDIDEKDVFLDILQNNLLDQFDSVKKRFNEKGDKKAAKVVNLPLEVFNDIYEAKLKMVENSGNKQGGGKSGIGACAFTESEQGQ